MPGAQHEMARLGNATELLVQSCLSTIAFTTRVERHDDVGHDFFCILSEVQDNMVWAGPSFTVQAKSNTDPVVFKEPHEIRWITQLESPFFLAVGFRAEARIDIYSTWCRLNGLLRRSAQCVILRPGAPTDGLGTIWTADDRSKQIISLGEPVISATLTEFNNKMRASELRQVLKQWIVLDRQNIVNTQTGLHWVIGPTDYRTNEQLRPDKGLILWTYYNAKNLPQCALNFGRAATSLRLTVHQAYEGREGQTREIAAQVKALDDVILAHWNMLESTSRTALQKDVGLMPDRESGGNIGNPVV